MAAWALKLFGISLVLATIAPMVWSGWKWIRVFDFPRLQIAALLLLTLIASGVFLSFSNPTDVAVAAAALIALLVQVRRVFPYTPIAPLQVRQASGGAGGSRLRLVISNVRMENRDSARLLEVVAAADPDIACFVETDDWWDRALTPLAAQYPYAIRRPQDNFYGMILYSRLPIGIHEVRYLIDEEVPSIHAEISLEGGQHVVVRCIHPVPPPLADTHERDAEILLVGKLCEASPLPNIVVGDLNDVGWSKITRLFIRTSGLVDPRIGRGLFASYHAQNPLLRWPLDHVFHAREFSVRMLQLLPDVGSDHFPVLAELCYEPENRFRDQPPSAADGDRKMAKELIRDGIEAQPAPDEYPPKNGD